MSYSVYLPFVGSGSSHAQGLVPDPGSTAGTTKFLREDGTFAVPSFTQTGENQTQIDAASGVSLKTSIKSVSANYTATANDGTILVDCSGGSVTVTLPSAATFYDSTNAATKTLNVKRIDATTANTLTITAATGQTIDGALTTTIPLNSGESTKGARAFQAGSGTAFYIV